MKIESSNVSMYSQSTFQYYHETTTNTQLQYGQSVNNQEDENDLQSKAFFLDFSYSNTTTISSNRVVYDYDDNMSFEDKIKKLLIEILLGRFYDKKKSVDMYPKSKPLDTNYTLLKPSMEQNPYIQQNQQTQQGNVNSQLIGIVFNHKEEYYQKQTVDFNTSLKVNTPNKSFTIDLSISYSQELYDAHSSKLVVGEEATKDPLVINYGEDINPFENISELKFEFDLDKDGTTDLIPMLKQGSGYLALDKNDNGLIDDGAELFGTDSGNGFKDLSKYDKDHNNWIDENDEVFHKLKIWQKDDAGGNKLVSLVDLNIGAIYLGDVQSGFKYQNGINNTEAIQKSNGIFLKEDGSGVGVVSSIDIVI